MADTPNGQGKGERLGARPRMEAGVIPDGVRTELTTVTTADGASAPAVSYHLEGATTTVMMMHPRQDLSRHYLIALLLRAGVNVWVQGVRSVNNDLNLLHEEAVLDAAAGIVRIRDAGAERVVLAGPSGGSTLFAFYVQQASRQPGDRLQRTPGGKPVALHEADMPVPDGVAFLAPHPGQGELLLGLIDPAVADEANPLTTIAELDLYSAANGFHTPPESSSYSPDFLAAYRAAQYERVARIDARAREIVAARRAAKQRFETSKDSADRRASLMTQVITVQRTDADPRCVDLSLDPSERPYGSIHGRRPDLINFGITGFGRLSTADAWLSTWSGISSQANFTACAPEVKIPSLFVEYTGDQATFPSVSREMFAALGSADKTHDSVPGTHFGGPITDGARPGGEFAGDVVTKWLAERFPTMPPKP